MEPFGISGHSTEVRFDENDAIVDSQLVVKTPQVLRPSCTNMATTLTTDRARHIKPLVNSPTNEKCKTFDTNPVVFSESYFNQELSLIKRIQQETSSWNKHDAPKHQNTTADRTSTLCPPMRQCDSILSVAQVFEPPSTAKTEMHAPAFIATRGELIMKIMLSLKAC